MLLGIDVGGTFTDAVVLSKGKIIAIAKKPTNHSCLLTGLLAAMDEVLAGRNLSQIKRIALSTTVVTNALLEDRLDKVKLYVLPGPGINIEKLVPQIPQILSGCIDHRGRVVAEPEENELIGAMQSSNERVCAVSGKFSIRNPLHEHKVADWLRKHYKHEFITIGSELSGSLNFLRRTNSAYFNSAVWRQFNKFADAVELAITERKIIAPIYILKADGGTIPLEFAGNMPIEAIFTGPAASVLGILAQGVPSGDAISLDIGGTTTDIALWQDGIPLAERAGAMVKGYVTGVKSFLLRSVGVGGDSSIGRAGEEIIVGPIRYGPAMAMGGQVPTVTDAMLVMGIIDYGDKSRAIEAMKMLAITDESPENVAEKVLAVVTEKISTAISDMLTKKIAEPVYKVSDIINSIELKPQTIIGAGGAAAGLVPLIARCQRLSYYVLPGAAVTNAIGAAVARPTLEITVRADTEQGYYSIAELGIKGDITKGRISNAQIQEIGVNCLTDRAKKTGIDIPAIEIIYQEEFNIVRGFSTVGKIVVCKLQIKPGVIADLSGREV